MKKVIFLSPSLLYYKYSIVWRAQRSGNTLACDTGGREFAPRMIPVMLANPSLTMRRRFLNEMCNVLWRCPVVKLESCNNLLSPTSISITMTTVVITKTHLIAIVIVIIAYLYCASLQKFNTAQTAEPQ